MRLLRQHLLGLAAASIVTAPALAQVTRSTEFSYDPTTGLVTLERVDPGGTHCVETEYEHDAYGNRRVVTVRPCASTSAAASFPERVTTHVFAANSDPAYPSPAGAYPTQSTVSSGATTLARSAAAYDARFGTPSAQTEVALADTTKNITRRTAYDGFGRVVREYVPAQRNDADNSVTETSVQLSRVICLGPLVTDGKPAACLDFQQSAATTYDSKRLVNAAGNVVTTATLRFVSAYYVESTPLGTSGSTVIGAKSRVHYDSLHREIAKEIQAYDGRWSRTLTGYDSLGQVAATWGAHFVAAVAPTTVPPADLIEWTSRRDYLHRPTEQKRKWRGVARATVEALTTTISYNGLETIATIPAGSAPGNIEREVRTVKNAAGQVTRTVNADGATLDMAYDPVGNLVRTVDALGNRTTVSYTAGTSRFKTGLSDPDQGDWSYVYDALGQMVSQTDARGKTITMGYDALGRLVSKNTGDLNATFFHAKNEDGSWCAWGLNRPCGNKTGTTTVVTREATGYDKLGRAVSSTSTLGRAYTSASSFDPQGRLASSTYPSGLRVNYAYSDGTDGKIPGVLERVTDHANSARVFWRIDTLNEAEVFDAQGHLLKARLGNGVVTSHEFDPISGKAFRLGGGTGTSTDNVFDQTYTYDKADNLATRDNSVTGASEEFAYDVLDRLKTYTATVIGNINDTHTTTIKYNALGNIIEKSDVGGYVYTAGSKPHAVRSAGGTSYTYDDNGNVLSTAGGQNRTHTWTDFNHPASLSYQGKRVEFLYDAAYKRVREITTNGGVVRTLYLVHPDNAGGLGFEREETRVGGTLTRNENRHYISVGGTVVAVVKTLNSGDPLTGALNGAVSNDNKLTQYWHKDSLGSIIAVSDQAGTVEHMGFDAWGRRQRASGKTDPWADPAHGDRGYTGHEHLDELALVHMNGRVYDPLLARFLSPDPILQAPQDLQNYNRFSYVLNNPVKYTDPSGQFIPLPVLFIAGMGMAMMGNEHWSMVGKLMMLASAPQFSGLIEGGLGCTAASATAVSAQTASLIGASATGGLMGFAASGGDFQASAIAALTAGAFEQVGANAGNMSKPERILAHALVGCASGAASGGRCGPSAMAAAFGKTVTEYAPAHNLVTVAVAGGTASLIGGGKFGSGAVSASFGYLFNSLAHPQNTYEAGVRQAILRGDVGELQALLGNGVLSAEDALIAQRALAAMENLGPQGAKMLAERYGVDFANKVGHAFGKEMHNLDGLVQTFGSAERAFLQVQRQVDSLSLSAGRFEQVVNVSGVNVTVRGFVQNGVAKIGTIFKP